MVKTTLYLPENVKRELEQLAAETGRSEADLIREGIHLVLGQQGMPRRGMAALEGLAALRARLPGQGPIDVEQLVREARDELDRRANP